MNAARPRSRVITVLFTDLVDSTTLFTSCTASEAEDLRLEHFGILRPAVASAGGTEVKSLGDGIMAVFESAADALSCAVAMQQGVDRRNHTGAITSLGLRVGIAIGEATVASADYHGAPVVEAARLCAVAEGGQILISDLVRSIAGAANGHRFSAKGELDLKGLPEPVSAWAVEWEPERGVGVPLPPLVQSRSEEFPFVGRAEEQELLDEVWQATLAGRRQAVLVSGEPGIGKTRLATRFAERVHASGGLVLAGSCDEDLGVPYQPIVEALTHFVEHCHPDMLAPRLGDHGPELARLAPRIREQLPHLASPPSSDTGTETYRLFNAVLDWLRVNAAAGPVLMVVGDLQWATRPTLQLLRHITRADMALPLCILGTWRDTDVGGRHPLRDLLADLASIPDLTRIRLEGLDLGDVEELVRQSSPAQDLSVAHRIQAEAEGNPFFVGELFRHISTGADLRGQLPVPEGVRDVIRRRVQRLPVESREALSTAAVIGQQFDVELLATVMHKDQDACLSALDHAVGAHLLDEVPATRLNCRFTHALVRSTLYEHDFHISQRVRLHRRIATAIETLFAGDLDSHLSDLAYHYREAAPGNGTGKAIHYLSAAGDAAAEALAHAEAATHYEAALDLCGSRSPSERCRLLIDLGDAQRVAGNPSHRERLLEAVDLAVQLQDVASATRAALANSRAASMSYGDVDWDRVHALEAALALLPDEPSGERSMLLADLAFELVLTGDGTRCRELSDDACGMARLLGDPRTRAHTLATRLTTIWGPETLQERFRILDELCDLMTEVGDAGIETAAAFHSVVAHVEMGDRRGARVGLWLLAEVAAQSGLAPALSSAAICETGLEIVAGNLDAAERLAMEWFELAQANGQADALPGWLSQIIAIRLWQGRLGEMQPHFAGLAERYPAVEQMLRSVEAGIEAELGNVGTTAALVRDLAADDFDTPQDALWMVATICAARATVAIRDLAGCATLYDRLLPFEKQVQFNGGFSFSSVAHVLGLLATGLGRWEAAERHFEAAVGMANALGAPHFLADSLTEWARMLLDRDEPGDRATAGGLLARSLESATAGGYDRVVRAAEALLPECEPSELERHAV